MRSVRVVVRGRVQGVFFRDTVSHEAEREGVAGWVRNRSDGSVEAHLEGDDEAVERVLEVCREGPDRAEVSDLEVEDAEAEGSSAFSVR